MAGFIKQRFPDCHIAFLGKTYTKEVIAMSKYVDEFINYDAIDKLMFDEQVVAFRKMNADIFVHVFPQKKIAQLAKAANIPLRVGTTNRLYHWFNCNKLIQLSRKNSLLHEAQLNFKLLSFLNVKIDVSISQIPSFYGFTNVPTLDTDFFNLIDSSKFNLILHPKSKGSAREWGTENFEKLIALLPKERYKLFITGTEDEGKLMPNLLKNPGIIDLTGKLSLNQLIAFINNVNGLVAASTGPLHIAAALNKRAIGLFVPKKPMHPGRWMPIGADAHAIVFDAMCIVCKNKKVCNCISKIEPSTIKDILEGKK